MNEEQLLDGICGVIEFRTWFKEYAPTDIAYIQNINQRDTIGVIQLTYARGGEEESYEFTVKKSDNFESIEEKIKNIIEESSPSHTVQSSQYYRVTCEECGKEYTHINDEDELVERTKEHTLEEGHRKFSKDVRISNDVWVHNE